MGGEIADAQVVVSEIGLVQRLTDLGYAFEITSLAHAGEDVSFYKRKNMPIAVKKSIVAAIRSMHLLKPAEMLVATDREMLVFDSPFTAAFALSALAEVRHPEVRTLANRYTTYLLRTMSPPGIWCFSPTWPQPLLPADVDNTACALTALHRWRRKEVNYECALSHVLGADGGREPLRTWLVPDVDSAPSGHNEVDVVINVNLLDLASRLGHPLPAIEGFVEAFVDKHGLNCCFQSIYYRSPFVFGYFMSRWLGREGPRKALRARVAQECADRLPNALDDPLSSALALSAMFRLGFSPDQRVLDQIVGILIESQTETGLWGALPMFVDPEKKTYGSIEMSTAALIEALNFYAQHEDVCTIPTALANPLRSPRRQRPPSTCDPYGRDANGHGRSGALDSTLEAIASGVPHELIAPEGLAAIRHACGSLPAGLTSGFGFETQLGCKNGMVDLSICINASSAGPYILAGLDRDRRLPAQLAHSAVWVQVGEFCREWVLQGSLLNRDVSRCWLEFDLEQTRPALPEPSVFVDLEGMRMPDKSRDREAAIARCQEIVGVTLASLGRPVPMGAYAETLDRVLDTLPHRAHIFALGVMLSRTGDGFRLCLKDIPPDCVLAYLEAAGWPGDADCMRTLLATVGDLADSVHLGLDIGEGLQSKVGLECSMSGHPEDQLGKWTRLLDEFVERNWCLVQKRDALLRWSGTYETSEVVNGELVTGYLDRLLSHVKLTVTEGTPPEAKGYFAAWKRLETRRLV